MTGPTSWPAFRDPAGPIDEEDVRRGLFTLDKDEPASGREISAGEYSPAPSELAPPGCSRNDAASCNAGTATGIVAELRKLVKMRPACYISPCESTAANA